MPLSSRWSSMQLGFVVALVIAFLAGRGVGQTDESRPKSLLAPAPKCTLVLHMGFPNDPNYQDLRLEFDPNNPPDLSRIHGIRESLREVMR